MAIRLTVFVTPDSPFSVKIASQIINRLHDVHLSPFVDAKHRGDLDWLRASYGTTEHRCFCLGTQLRVPSDLLSLSVEHVSRIETLDPFDVPDLIVWYDGPVTDDDWAAIERYFCNLCEGSGGRTILTRRLSHLLSSGESLTPRPTSPPLSDRTNDV